MQKETQFPRFGDIFFFLFAFKGLEYIVKEGRSSCLLTRSEFHLL